MNMKTFNKRFVVGTKIKFWADGEWHLIAAIFHDRKLIKVTGMIGSMPRSHIYAYSNKKRGVRYERKYL